MALAHRVYLDREFFVPEIVDNFKGNIRGAIAKHRIGEVYNTTKDTLRSRFVIYQFGEESEIALEAFQSLEVANARRMS